MGLAADFPYESRYIEVHGHRLHYVERGEGPVFLFLHGNPTWSYLWRNVIPKVAGRGRCIAVDLLGFGLSDRPETGYKFPEHYHYIDGFIEKMGLKDIIIVGHDWGGVIGLYYAMHHEDNVKGVAFMESFPFTFKWDYFPPKFRWAFRVFRTWPVGEFVIAAMNVFIEKMLPAGVHRGLPREAHDNYRRVFPTAHSRYPIYVWPNELPIEGREGETFKAVKRLEWHLPKFRFPMLLVTAHPGAIITPEKAEWLRKTINDLTVMDIGSGIHYLQEDNPEAIGDGIAAWAVTKGLVSGRAAA